MLGKFLKLNFCIEGTFFFPYIDCTEKNLYQKQLTTRKILTNDNMFDSLLFLSKSSDKKISGVKKKMMWKMKTLDFKNCITHLHP